MSNSGMEYQMKYSSQLISVYTNVRTLLNCLSMCNINTVCRTLDYDSQYGRCRLFNGDLTTGSIITSNSSTSIVGNIYIDQTRYVNYGQQCFSSNENRYEVCNDRTSTYGCPETTYWDGSICRCQLFENQTCNQVDSCRGDLNLTCLPATNCTGLFTQCKKTMNLAANTVAGNCNGIAGTGNQSLSGPADIFLRSDGTLFVADSYNNRIQAFAPNSRVGTTVVSLINQPQGLFIDSLFNLYLTSGSDNKVIIRPTDLSVTAPSSSIYNWLVSFNGAYGIAVDHLGNVYVSSSSLSIIRQWNINNINITVNIANSATVNQPRHMFLDQNNSVLYVADTANHRIMEFFLKNNYTSQTVAGVKGTLGSTPDKLSSPAGVFVSRLDGAIYVADTNNNRIQKWLVNASTGITVAGNSNGIAGSDMYSLQGPTAVTLDYAEEYMYVADCSNHRVQRFLLL